MLFWITIVMVLLAVQILLPPSLNSNGTMSERLSAALGPRDQVSTESVVAQRGRRALVNLYETLPFFLTFALLAIILQKEVPHAILGAQIYAIARVLYLGAYLSGVPVIRTLIWAAAMIGLVLMAEAVLG